MMRVQESAITLFGGYGWNLAVSNTSKGLARLTRALYSLGALTVAGLIP